MPERDEQIKKVLKAYGERSASHEQFCDQVGKRRRAYLGQVEKPTGRKRSNVEQWRSQLYPPYAMQVAEGVVANLIDDNTRFRCRARPKMGPPEELKKAIDGARALEIVLSYLLDVDRFNQKQRPFALQAAIAGLTAAKTYWAREQRLRTRTELVAEPIYDDYGYEVGADLVEREVTERQLIRDDPTMEVVRIEDLLWEESATDLQSSPWVIHRVAATLDDLKRLEQLGEYKNVSKLTESDTGGFTDEFVHLDEALTSTDRFKNRVELLEHWCREEDGTLRCITVANRRVLLADRRGDELFQHNQFPFVACSLSPDLFKIPGISLIEKVASLQEYLWSLMNQRLDNVFLTNNAIYAVRRDLLDRDQFEVYPGAVWGVEGDPREAVAMFAPDPNVGRLSIESESLAKGDIQNVTGGMPFMAGVDQATLDQKTATGVSIVTSIAQRMVMAQKQQLSWAFEQIADQWVGLMRQYMTEPRLVQIAGLDGAIAFKLIDPETIAGFDYHINVEATGESLLRQERRAEAQALLQIIADAAPALVQLGSTPNVRAYVEDVLRAYEKDDIERYFKAEQGPPMGGMPGQAPPGMPGQEGQTNPQLAAGPMSPSNQTSMSPEVFMQQALAATGGANNGG